MSYQYANRVGTYRPTGAKRLGKTVTHSDAYKIVIILDESGSMSAIRHDMIESINSLIREQRTIDRPCKFTLIRFNDIITRDIKNTSLKDVPLLNPENYDPKGKTALYDAIGDTIDWYRYEENVLLVIVTDGQENASQVYKREEIRQLLDEKKSRGWNYVYLANDLSVSKQGLDIGCNKSMNSSNCQVAQEKYGEFVRHDLNNAIRNSRIHGSTVQSFLNRAY